MSPERRSAQGLGKLPTITYLIVALPAMQEVFTILPEMAVSPYPMLACPSSLRKAVMPISATCRAGFCQI